MSPRHCAGRLRAVGLLLLLGACRAPNPGFQATRMDGPVEPDAAVLAEDALAKLDDDAGAGVDARGMPSSDVAAPPADGGAAACRPWWKPAFARRLPLALSPGTGPLAAGAWASISFDHAALVKEGQSRPDGFDVRVVRWNGSAWVERPYFVDERSAWNMPTTTLWFRVEAPVTAADDSYTLHFGNPTANRAAAGRPAAVLREVQTGTAVSTAEGTSLLPLRPVDPSRSFVMFQTRHTGNRPTDAHLQVRLASSTSLQVRRATNETAPSPISLRYAVLEFAAGVRVQRGLSTQTAAVVTARLQPVFSTRQAFVLFSKVPFRGNQDFDGNDGTIVRLMDPTTLELRVFGVQYTDHEVAWEVVEMTNPEDLDVQRGQSRISELQVDMGMTLTSSVDLARTFLLTGALVQGSTNSMQVGGKLIRARLSSPNTVIFDRGWRASFAVPMVAYEAVQLGGGASVESGLVDLGPGELSKRIALRGPVDPGTSVAFTSVQMGGGQNMGSTPFVGDDVLGACALTLTPMGSELLAERATAPDRCSAAWFVVRFPRSGQARVAAAAEARDVCR